MKVAVTGGSGFVGSAVAKELTRRDHLVVLLDKSLGVDVTKSNLTGMTEGLDAVVHLAGVLGTAELFGRVEDAIDVNIKGTARVLEACVANRLRYVGITIPSVWVNIYQATKRAALELAQTYHEHHGIEVAHVRAFNVFGEKQKVRGVQKIVPTFAHRAWRNLPLPVWGNGFQLVDMIDVEQVAMVFADVVSMKLEKPLTVDAGTGQPLTVIQIVDEIRRITGSSSEIEYLPMRPGEDPKADVIARGEGWNHLNWRPWYDPRRLEQTVKWYQGDRP